MASLQRSDIGLVLDNFSSHTVEYQAFDHVTHVFLPSNTTSVLQPVYCSVGRSFKCTYRRLLVAHIFRKVNSSMELEANERPPFKLTQAVTAYDSILRLCHAWDLLLNRFLLKAWLNTDILSQPQRQYIEQLLLSCGYAQVPAIPPQYNHLSQAQASKANARSLASKARGLDWLEHSEEEPTTSQPVIEEIWANENITWSI